MRKTIFLTALVCCLLFMFSCTKQNATTNRNATSATNGNTTASPSPTAHAAVTGDKVGVAECDDFIAAYEACISSKIPEASRAQYRTTVEQWRASWRSLAANPQTRASLGMACKTAAQQASQTMKSHGCKF
jgi:hypothetical protein